MPQKLGQHFLKNESVLKKITQTLNLKKGDFVIEIGPGHGELTKYLKSEISKVKIIAIEKDGNLVKILNDKFVNDPGVKIVEGDALKEIKNQISKIKTENNLKNSEIISNLKIVGNIPYYITGHLLRIIGELENKPSKTVLLIQKEVAQRICAKAPHSNLLSLSVQFWAEPMTIQKVLKKDFSPSPEVDSAVIELMTKKEAGQKNADKYYSFLKKAFKQPRKTLQNNLGYFYKDKAKIIDTISIFSLSDKSRPQDLTLKDAESLSLLF